MGSNLTPLPRSAEGGGSKTEQSLSTLILSAKRGLGFVLLPPSMTFLSAHSSKLPDRHPTPPPWVCHRREQGIKARRLA
jgi:hypothetical protein